MSKVGSIGSNPVPVSNSETITPATSQPKAATEAATTAPAAQQDPKVKAGEVRFDGQVREAQIRSQLGSNSPQWKMPGVEVSGPPVDDPKIEKELKNFDKPMPSVEMNWPEKGDFKESTTKDGSLMREMTDADGNKYREITKDGMREREITDKDGNRKFEATHPDGFVMRGGADNKGNSWTFDSKGDSTRMHKGESGETYMESKQSDGTRIRQMYDTKGNSWKETMKDGKIEREREDAKGNRQMELREKGSWLRGFSDTKGNSYSVDNKGNETRMHFDQASGNSFSEHTFNDGSRSRQIYDKQGNSWSEFVDKNGRITRTEEKNVGK
jgi:YD repeat-containing protein